MAGVTPEQIYQSLLSAGASTVQAIGIMANMINESSLSPEAVGDSGTSFGLAQDHGAYAYLVTGNPVADMQRQVSTIASLGGIKAASGSTPQEAAGNFAANFERCVGCQPGGAQYNQRVANAATVAGWVSSGNWPQASSTGLTSAAQQGSAAAQLAGQSPGAPQNCAWQLFGGINLPLIGNVGSICVLTNSQARALIGGAVLAGGFLIAGAGMSLIAVAAALPLASKVAGLVPGAGRAAGLFRRGTGGSSAPSPPPPVYSGSSPSGTTPPSAPARQNVSPSPAKGTSVPRQRTGGRTSQGTSGGRRASTARPRKATARVRP